jgi:hypothetical protein
MEAGMAGVSVVGPDGGETMQIGPVGVRILEDGSSTAIAAGRPPTGRALIEAMRPYATEPAGDTGPASPPFDQTETL